ncbi:MAG: sterol desaturase family protein [Flavipsychrobacter sp.]
MEEQIKSWLLANGELYQYWFYFGTLAILILLERAIPKRLNTVHKKQRWVANFGLTILNILFMGLQPVNFIMAATFAGEQHWGLLNQLTSPLVVVLVLSLLLRGFISFFTHWMMHRVPFLWRIHRVHHLDKELDVSSTVRFHPLEFYVNTLVGVPMVVLFGLSPWVLLGYELLDVLVTLWSHANICLPRKLNGWLRYIIVTPDLHRIHHSSYQPETDSNFGAVFPIWDILFHTYRTKTREPQEKMEIGLEEVRDERTEHVGWLLLSPFKNIKQKKL